MGGYKNILPAEGKKTQFTSENQPSPKAKRDGKRRKRTLRELAEALISGDALGKAKSTAERIGLELDDDEYTAEVVMTLRLMEKVLAKGDVPSYNSVMDRLVGKPKQSVELENNIKIGDGIRINYID